MAQPSVQAILPPPVDAPPDAGRGSGAVRQTLAEPRPPPGRQVPYRSVGQRPLSTHSGHRRVKLHTARTACDRLDMRKLPYVVTLCAALVASVPAAAAVPKSSLSQAEGRPLVKAVGVDDEVLWNYNPALLGWRWTDAFQTFSGSISLYLNPTSEGAPTGRPTRLRFVARRLDRRAGRPDQITWTDSDRCPALLRLAEQFQTLDPPRAVIPGFKWPPEFPQTVLDGVSWTLWTTSAQQVDRYPAYSQFSSNAGAIADWGVAARRAMEGCWVAHEPLPTSRSG